MSQMYCHIYSISDYKESVKNPNIPLNLIRWHKNKTVVYSSVPGINIQNKASLSDNDCLKLLRCDQFGNLRQFYNETAVGLHV